MGRPCRAQCNSFFGPLKIGPTVPRQDKAGWQPAERSAAAERAAKQVAEELLASEAALADATVEIARNECAARRQAETQRDI